MVVFGKKWLYSGKSGFFSGKVFLYSVKSGFIQAKCFCIQSKVVVSGQSGCDQAKRMYYGKNCIREKLL